MIYSELTETLRQIFGDNLVGVLLYGSSLTSTHPADLDLLVLLNNKADVCADLMALKAFKEKYPAVYFDLQLIYAQEYSDPNNFSLDSHGCFFLAILRRAHVLWGVNPFVSLEASPEAILKSAVRKLQYYSFRARQMYLGEAYRSKDQNRDFHRKKLIMAMTDVLLAVGQEAPLDVLAKFCQVFPDQLTPTEVEILSSTGLPLDIHDAIGLYEKLYSIVLNLLPEK